MRFVMRTTIAVCLLGASSLLMLPASALAAVAGDEALGPDPDYEFEGPYELVATGASLLSCEPLVLPGLPIPLGGNACTGNPSATWSVGGFPAAGRFEAAWLIWSQSREPDDPVDTAISLELPGSAAVELAADEAASADALEDVRRRQQQRHQCCHQEDRC